MTAEIISVGTELLLGNILNTNAQYLSRELAALGITVQRESTIGDIDSMSLEKTSPFATPSPKPFTMNGGLYRETQYGMPAMIPHDVKNFRITKNSNPCMMCHADTAKIGAKKVKGEPVAMPETHWTTVDGKKVMHPSRYECLLCHAPQAEVEPLVGTLH